MKFNFRFSNLLGTVYSKGNLIFNNTGDSIISPVGNRVTVFNLKNNTAETYPFEAQFNIVTTAISPDGLLLLLVDEEGECLLCNTRIKAIIHRFHFGRKIHAIKFSPDGRKFVVCKENTVLLYHAPGHNKEFNPFVMQRSFYGAYDVNVCLDWTSDSAAVCVGSKDMNVRIHATDFYENLTCYVLGGQRDTIMGCFFEKNSLNTYVVSHNGRLNVWECDTALGQLVKKTKRNGLKSKETGVDDDIWNDHEEKESHANGKKTASEQDEEETLMDEQENKSVLYKKKSKFGIRDALQSSVPIGLTSCDFNKATRILVSGFSNGSFLLHELPEFNLIHSLSISEHPISTCVFNPAGNWIGLACEKLGQLLVWEWQSETYVLKQQGHFNNMTRLAYSPSGLYIASGGEDGKVKMWNTTNGQCFVTFGEHNAAITGLHFKGNGQVVCSSSLDGTVRAFDLNRYRNFRTMTTPQPVQFSCLALDPSGELVAAGGADVFDIFVWSMQTGHLVQTLSGHEGPISACAFTPTITKPLLASSSWDKTLRTWDVFEGSKGGRETYTLNSEILALCFRSDGKRIAASTLDSRIVIVDVNEFDQQAIVATIECKHDVGYSRKETDKVTAKKLLFGKSWTSLSFTVDGEYLLAGGKSKYICIYNINEQMLVKRFEISQNKSFDGINEFLDRRKMTEWGNMNLVETSNEDEDRDKANVSLPGVAKGDHSARAFKPEIQVSCVSFSPTSRSWSACSTEGLLLYSLDSALLFDPFDLEINITPSSVAEHLAAENYAAALMQALRLNEESLTAHVCERTPHNSIELVVGTLGDMYVDKLISFVATKVEQSVHLEFYLRWCQAIIYKHGNWLKQCSWSKVAYLCHLEKAVTNKLNDLIKICNSNKYSIDYVLSIHKIKQKKKSAMNVDDQDQEGGDDEDHLNGDVNNNNLQV